MRFADWSNSHSMARKSKNHRANTRLDMAFSYRNWLATIMPRLSSASALYQNRVVASRVTHQIFFRFGLLKNVAVNIPRPRPEPKQNK